MNNIFKRHILAVAIMAAMPMAIYAEDSRDREHSDAQRERDDKAPAVSGELVIQFKKDATDADKARVLGKIGGEVKENVKLKGDQNNDKGDADLVRHRPEFTRAAAKAEIEADPAVEYAEPNYIYTHDSVSNDTYQVSGQLWGMQNSPTNIYGSQASTAWANGATNCGTVYVGIIDEGYMYTHEDLAANAGKNPKEIAGNKIDDDKNGYVDDVYGWDFDGKNSSVFDGIQDDHGTHVAGTIGGIGGNSKGVAGVCWSVQLLNAKFLGNAGGTLANAIKAVDYFTNLKKQGVNIVATNNSWGGGGFSQGLKDAIERANAAGILFVAAAGNAATNIDNSATPSYPASYDNANIISVASLASDGTLSSFSNYGATSVDLGAPGSGIISTVPTTVKGKIVSGYANYSGTSMATPHVTGACALYAARNPGVSAADIKAAVLGDAQVYAQTPSLLGKTLTAGRLDVSRF